MKKKSETRYSNRQLLTGSYRIFLITLSIFFIIFSGSMVTTGKGCYAQEFAGKLVFSEGSVTFSLDKGKSWSQVSPEMEFPEGTYIKTSSDGQAALMLNDRSQIRLAPNSVIYLKTTGSAPDQSIDKPGLLEIFSGWLWFRNKRKGSKPVFETPVISASIRGTEMAIHVADDGTSDIVVLEGQVKCANLQGEAIIARGEGATAQRGMAPVITKLIRPEKSVQWLLLTPDIRGPADADIMQGKDGNTARMSTIDINGIKLAEKAMELLAQGEDGALQTARQAVNFAPGRASTHVALATVLQSKGKFEQALQEARIGYRLDPFSVPALVRTVELLLGLDHVASAEKMITQFKGAERNNNAEAADNTDARISMLKGYISLIKLDSTNAETLFRQVIETKRDLSSAYLGLGLALYHQKKTAEGLENMEKACLLEPLAAYPHTYLAKAQYQLGEREEAKIELKRATILDPYDPTPHMYLATILTDTYRPGEGIKALEKSITLNDNKLMTRSRYLLDQDRASKNISLAWSLVTMGLYEWADAKGDQAVWDDESNSSAYLFRASRAQVLGQVDADTIGDMKRADLLKPVNGNTYTSYYDYQNLLETPEIKGSLTLNGGTDKTGSGAIDVRGGAATAAFHGSVNYSTTDGPVEGSSKSSRDGMASIKKEVASGHEILAEARALKGDRGDIALWQDGFLQPQDIDRDYDELAGALGYHWHQESGRDMMVLLQSQTYDSDTTTLYEKYLSSIDTTQFKKDKSVNNSDTLRAEIVQLFRLDNQETGDHRISAGISRSETDSSYESTSTLYYEPPFQDAVNSNSSSIDSPDRRETRLFARDIWSVADTFKFDMGLAWCELDNIISNDKKELETEDQWLPHLGFMWQLSESDTIRCGYFRESEPVYLSGTLQPVEMAGFSRIFGSSQGTLTEFYGAGWDRQWSSQIFTRAELYHKKREFPDSFTSHTGYFKTAAEQLDLSWNEERQDSVRFAFEYLVSERMAMAFTYQLTDHNTDSGIDRNRVDNDLGLTFTWVHPSGVRVQNSWWYMSQNEKSGYKDPVDEDFIIAGITVEKSLFDKKMLIVARWENIFDEKYTYLISDTTESSQLPWQGSFASLCLQWNF